MGLGAGRMADGVLGVEELSMERTAGVKERRLSVDEYHRMIDAGAFSDRRVELLEGVVVEKMTHNPPHDGTIQLVEAAIALVRAAGWCIRIQASITLSTSEPEPDLCVARGNQRTYLSRHPRPADIGMVVEVSDSSLQVDRADKGRIYAEAGIEEYWIVNLIDGQVEVFTGPSGPGTAPGYANRQVYVPGGSVPLVLDGATLGQIAVGDLLP